MQGTLTPPPQLSAFMFAVDVPPPPPVSLRLEAVRAINENWENSWRYPPLGGDRPVPGPATFAVEQRGEQIVVIGPPRRGGLFGGGSNLTVNVTMPLFGVLNIEPNTRDIAEVNVVRGGATAVDFNRDIRPILSENCFSCHGPDESGRKGKRRLEHLMVAVRTREGVAASGPNADGRIDPEVVANGLASFVQGANGGISLVNGTSFSSPTVAGVAAPVSIIDDSLGAIVTRPVVPPITAQPQPKPYSHAFAKNSDSLAVKKWCTLSGLRTKKR